MLLAREVYSFASMFTKGSKPTQLADFKIPFRLVRKESVGDRSTVINEQEFTPENMFPLSMNPEHRAHLERVSNLQPPKPVTKEQYKRLQIAMSKERWMGHLHGPKGT